MIIMQHGETRISGELSEILADVTHLLRIIYKQMKDTLGEEKANLHMRDIGRLAVISDEELSKMAKEDLERWLNEN